MPIRVLRVELREQEQVPVAHILLSPGQLGARSGQHRLTAELFAHGLCGVASNRRCSSSNPFTYPTPPTNPEPEGMPPMSGHKPCSPLSKMFSWNFTSSSRMSRSSAPDTR